MDDTVEGKRNFMMSVNTGLRVFKGSISGHLHFFFTYIKIQESTSVALEMVTYVF